MAYAKGYSKAHPGQHALVIDWETTGSDFGGDSSVAYQGIAFGVIVADTQTWEEVDTLYRELHFDETKYKWTDGAEKIHGLSRAHLAEHGVPREEALADLLELLLKYWAPGQKIMLIGHNASFDRDFTEQLFRDFGVEILIHHVMPDSSQLGFVLMGEYKSDVVFDLLGGIDKRNLHNALEDARACLTCLRNAKQIFTAGLEAGAEQTAGYQQMVSVMDPFDESPT
jgi:DNA polymerase III epsilon subunit-like protein